jgi:hypothetical protein
MPRRGLRQQSSAAVVWSRPKLLALLAGTTAVVLLLLTGLVLVVIDAVIASTTSTPAPASSMRRAAQQDGSDLLGQTTVGDGTATAEVAARDQLAARPMVAVPEFASHPEPVSLTDPGSPIVLPPSTGSGPAGVPTGFSHTPVGALAQLAAIDQSALGSGSLAGVRAVIAGWALPGGPTTSNWSGVAAIARLLTAAGLSGGGSPQLAIVATPLMGLIKGTVGPDFVVPCIDLELDITLTSTARGAVADCQRMVWQAGRWWIGLGPEPALAPSVWPDTDLAVQVGYRDLRRG